MLLRRQRSSGLPTAEIQPKQSKRESGGERNAYLTVFLSLSLPVILSLFFVLLEGARIGAIQMEIEVVTDTAADSVLAEFHKELFDQYDLLMIDTSYGTSSPSVSNTEEHLQTYMEKNFTTSGSLLSSDWDFTGLSVTSVSIGSTRFAADNGAEALREQIYAYYSAEPVGAVVAEILEQVDTFNGLSLDTSEWSSLKSSNESALKEGVSSALAEAAEEDSTEEESETEAEENTAAAEAQSYVESQGVSVSSAINIYSTLDSLMSAPILTQVFGSTASLSQATTDTSQLISGRSIHTGDGAEAENSHDYAEADTIVFDLYAFEKCGSYVNQLDKSAMKYQLEYLLYGKSSDISNLEKTAETILLIRLAANLITIMQDSEKIQQAELWGTLLATICFAQEQLKPLFTAAVLLIWTYMESLVDVRALLKGDSVPLVKSSSEWTTGLTSIFTGTTSSVSSGSGLDYEAYLHILLFLEDGTTKNYRLMDLMEMDIRETDGNENFKMDWCMDTFTVDAVVSSAYGYSYTISREASYE